MSSVGGGGWYLYQGVQVTDQVESEQMFQEEIHKGLGHYEIRSAAEDQKLKNLIVLKRDVL
jgi:hypothetical protein